jgi:hypothetical protein
MRLWLGGSVVLLLCGCGTPPVLVDSSDSGTVADAGSDAGVSASPLFGLFHLEGQLDGGQLATTASNAENYEFRADGQFRFAQRGCDAFGGSVSNASGAWERLGNGLAVPSDDKPGKPRFVFEPADAGTLVRHLEGSVALSLWAVGGRCGSCDAGVLLTHSCADPF